MIPLSSLMWPKEYLNMCHIFYNNFSVIFLQHAWKRPQKSFQTKILSVTSSVNHCLITTAIDKRYWNVPSPKMGIFLQLSCMFVHNTNQNTFNFNDSCYARNQYKDNKGTNWPLYGNMQFMLSLGEGAFQ